ncbi:GGDEF domain-containing protein [Streptomyces rimosus]|uniref:GGDEF domain-containing protein n=1 Tax=Streptomyces rimosus TaxID=1927 RepID=UPI00099BC23B|nr:GGDEF domain-containing protein [Streptomyces rimosus]
MTVPALERFRDRAQHDPDVSWLLNFAVGAVQVGRYQSQVIRRLSEELEQARHDPLTGLLTRAGFELYAPRTLGLGPCVVLLIDLDGLKQLNDCHGHDAGDAAIRAAGAAFDDPLGLDPSLVAGRLGGDEFAAVVYLPDVAVLPWLLRGLHDDITAPFAHRGQSLTVGVSIGACLTADLPAVSLPLALRLADEAMYEAKRSGGGWRVTAGPAPAHRTVNGRRHGRRGTALEGTTS